MRSLQSDVTDFHERMDQPIGTGFTEAGRALRDRLIKEETEETIDAIVNRKMIEVIDGLCDCLYVSIGAAVSFGIRLSEYPIRIDITETMTEPHFSLAEESIDLLRGAQILTTVALVQEELYVIAPAIVGYIASVLVVAERLEVPICPFWHEVHRSNMAKADGPVRADGKRLKPVGWTPPDLQTVYRELFGKRAPI